MSATNLTFYYDPVCPWAWITSRWVLDLEKQGVVDVSWKLMSLARLNKDNDDYDPERFEPYRVAGRIAAAAASVKGDGALGAAYTEIGTRIHVEKREMSEELVTEVLAALDAPAELAPTVFTDVYDAGIAESHDIALALAGPDIGTPVLEYNGKSFFGPVMRAPLTGADAVKVWDAMLLLAEVDGIYEIKRFRTEGPVVA